jgi:serine/threonine protein phosphatase PrpC
LRIADSAGLTDAGRKRRRNEDSFVVEPPLFAVADGMGGAQAGEVASRLAAAVFREFHEADELAPPERVVAIIQEANRRIHERARSDREVSGMGTTITAALLAGDEVAIGHVGDSRAYVLREGRLEQLTEDHSLVADLVRSGRLSPAEAETHPQRSVITRALGTDSEVDVDAFSVAAAPGDVFLLCSDGLTTMVEDDEIRDRIEEAKSLEQAVRALVKSANRHGGEDNVTVVLFALVGDESDALEETAVMSGDGRPPEPDLEDTLSGLETTATAAVLEADRETRREPAPSAAPPVARARWRRRLFLSFLGLAFVLVLVAVAFWGLSRAHFVGAEEDGSIAVYQGLPWDVGGGVSLYRARYVSRIQAVQLTAGERAKLFDHHLLSYDDARARIARYEAEGVP